MSSIEQNAPVGRDVRTSSGEPQPGIALTVGEIRAAYDASLLTAEEARRRLTGSGMSPADAAATVERWATEGRNWAAR